MSEDDLLVPEAVVALLHLVVLDNSENPSFNREAPPLSSRRGLVTELDRLATLLAVQRNGTVQNKVSLVTSIEVSHCQIRQIAHETRQDLAPLLTRLAAEQSAEQSDFAPCWKWYLACHLLPQLKSQVLQELEAVDRAIDVVDQSYTDASIVERLQSVQDVFAQRSKLLHHPWTRAVLKLMEGKSQCLAPAAVVGARTPSVLVKLPSTERHQRRMHPFESIAHLVNDFVNAAASPYWMARVMLVGEPGSGKSYHCREIASTCRAAGISVIQPTLPLDLLGATAGEAENNLVAMVSTLYRRHHVVLLLDNLDQCLVATDNAATADDEDERDVMQTSAAPSHIQRRLQGTLCTLLDSLKDHVWPWSHVLVVMTSQTLHKGLLPCCDCTFSLGAPCREDRQHTILSELALDYDVIVNESNSQQLLHGILESTVGKSFAEIIAVCRDGLGGCNSDDGPAVLLQCVQGLLHSVRPASMSSASLASAVDVRVWCGPDLYRALSRTVDPLLVPANLSSSTYELPLHGQDIQRGWHALRSNVIIPVCRAREMAALRNCNASALHTYSGRLAGGVLLCGPPGCGKSALAMHAAVCAAQLLPSVKLLEVSCTSLIHKEVGGSERAIHALFESARQATPCIVLLDGIDSIAAMRGNDATTEGTLDRVLSTLLVELDGIDVPSASKARTTSEREGMMAVIGIARDASWIDPALLRPGRLGKTVYIEKPDLQARRAILEQLLNGQHAHTSWIDEVAEATEGMTGASLEAFSRDIQLLYLQQKRFADPMTAARNLTMHQILPLLRQRW